MPRQAIGFENWHFIGLTRSVRENVRINSFLSDRTQPAPPDPATVPDISWGQASQFTFSSTNPDTGINQPGTVTFPPDPTEDPNNPPPGVKILEFPENQDPYPRTVETIRVKNPSDAQQWVDIERINDITFEPPSDMHDALIAFAAGRISKLYIKLILKNKPA